MESIWETIQRCKKSLFRFEGLQDYSAEDGEEALEFFIRNGILKEVPDWNNEWWKEMKARNDQGVVTQRVRLVIEPVTDYTKMELEYLKKAKEYSGDDIRVIYEDNFVKIAPNGLHDFYLVDDERLFLMQYGPKGKYISSYESDEIQEYLNLKELLLRVSIPL